MFLGRYHHSIDSKGRLTVPAKFRDLLSDGAYVSQGFERNLMVMTAPTFASLSERVNNMSLTAQTTRELRRLIFASADAVETDKNGRILIPQFLREVAGLEGEAVLVGVGDYFEIWSPEAWEKQQAKMGDADANAQRFEALDLALGQS